VGFRTAHARANRRYRRPRSRDRKFIAPGPGLSEPAARGLVRNHRARAPRGGASIGSFNFGAAAPRRRARGGDPGRCRAPADHRPTRPRRPPPAAKTGSPRWRVWRRTGRCRWSSIGRRKCRFRPSIRCMRATIPAPGSPPPTRCW
jgi:hypothetical protein